MAKTGRERETEREVEEERERESVSVFPGLSPLLLPLPNTCNPSRLIVCCLQQVRRQTGNRPQGKTRTRVVRPRMPHALQIAVAVLL